MYSLEEVKEHFKNAATVRCITDGKIYDFKPDERGIHLYDKMYWIDTLERDSILLCQGDQLAEIVSYKQPNHYGERPDVIDFNTKYDLNFNLGSAVKYIARAGKKENESKEKDLKKAIDCIKREMETKIGKWYHVGCGLGVLKWNGGERTEGVWGGDYGKDWHFLTLEGAVEASEHDVINALSNV